MLGAQAKSSDNDAAESFSRRQVRPRPISGVLGRLRRNRRIALAPRNHDGIDDDAPLFDLDRARWCWGRRQAQTTVVRLNDPYGWYSSPVTNPEELSVCPPATRTRPLGSSVAVKASRTACMLPVACQVR